MRPEDEPVTCREVPEAYRVAERAHEAQGARPEGDRDRAPWLAVAEAPVRLHRRGGRPAGGESGKEALTMPEHALGIRAVERKAREELGGHAAAVAGAVGPACVASSPARRLPQPGEELRSSRHTAAKPPDLRMLPARNSGCMTNGQAYTSPTGSTRHTTAAGAAQVEPGEWAVPERAEVEEGVARQHLRVRDEESRAPCASCSAVGRSSCQLAAPGPKAAAS